MEKRSKKTDKLLGDLHIMGSNRRLTAITLALSSMVFGLWIDFALTYRTFWGYLSATFWLLMVILSYKALQIESGDDEKR